MKYFQNAAVGVAAGALAANQPGMQVLIQSDTSNVATVFVGDSTIQPFSLVPGQSMTVGVSANVNEIQVRSSAGTAVLNCGVI